jgi:hypothetical protein
MNEKQYEEKLLGLIRQLKDNIISRDEFAKSARVLGKELDKSGPNGYMRIVDFEDEELGWAKYWIEEVDYYGIEHVMDNSFNFINFLDNKGKGV